MVSFLMYVFGEFKQQKLTLGMLVELSGLHVNSMSDMACMTTDPSPTAFPLDDSTHKPSIPSVETRSWQSRSPPGQHSRSSSPIPQHVTRELPYVSAYHTLLRSFYHDNISRNSLQQIFQSVTVDATSGDGGTTSRRESCGSDFEQPAWIDRD